MRTLLLANLAHAAERRAFASTPFLLSLERPMPASP